MPVRTASVRFYLYYSARKCELIFSKQKQISSCLGRGPRTGRTGRKNPRKLLEVMDMFIILTVVMVSWVDAYVQTCQITYFKDVFIVCHYISINF